MAACGYNVLREVTHLVQRIPDRKLKIALGRALGKMYADVHQMVLRVGQFDRVFDRRGFGLLGWGRGQGRAWPRQQQRDEKQPAHHARDVTSLRRFRRWGSLS